MNTQHCTDAHKVAFAGAWFCMWETIVFLINPTVLLHLMIKYQSDYIYYDM